jgi:hypothetical protein
MKMLFLVRLFETIQVINASNAQSLSFHEVGVFVDFLYIGLGAFYTVPTTVLGMHEELLKCIVYIYVYSDLESVTVMKRRNEE